MYIYIYIYNFYKLAANRKLPGEFGPRHEHLERRRAWPSPPGRCGRTPRAF